MSGSFVSPELRTRVRALAEPIGRGLARLGLSPNALTLIGFGIACLAAIAAAARAWLVAGLLVIFGGDLRHVRRPRRPRDRQGQQGRRVHGLDVRPLGGGGRLRRHRVGRDRPRHRTGPPSSPPRRWPRRSWSATPGPAPRASASPRARAWPTSASRPREVRLVILTAGLVIAGIAGPGNATPSSLPDQRARARRHARADRAPRHHHHHPARRRHPQPGTNAGPGIGSQTWSRNT